jgi:hypothetical protein
METRYSGLLFPSKGPIFLPAETVAQGGLRAALRLFSSVGQPFLAVLFVFFTNPPPLINLPRHRDIQMPQHMLHFRIPQT